MKTNETPLKIKGLTKSYGEVKAVDNLSLDLYPGEIFGLLGPNGAGKTSLISCLVTLQKPTQGTIQLFGHDIEKKPREAKLKVGIVPQENVNHGFFNVYEIMTFHSGYYGQSENADRIEYLLRKVQLWEHRSKRVRQLSGGMKRRLQIAKSLVHSPKLWLLDEPTAGVDVELRSMLWSFVKDLKKEGVTILLTTHYLEEAEALCDRVGILNKGKLLKVEETQSLIQSMTQKFVHIEFESELASSFESNPYFVSHKGDVNVFSMPASRAVGELLSSLNCDLSQVKDIRVEEGRLEDAFKQFVYN